MLGAARCCCVPARWRPGPPPSGGPDDAGRDRASRSLGSPAGRAAGDGEVQPACRGHGLVLARPQTPGWHPLPQSAAGTCAGGSLSWPRAASYGLKVCPPSAEGPWAPWLRLWAGQGHGAHEALGALAPSQGGPGQGEGGALGLRGGPPSRLCLPWAHCWRPPCHGLSQAPRPCTLITACHARACVCVCVHVCV